MIRLSLAIEKAMLVTHELNPILMAIRTRPRYLRDARQLASTGQQSIGPVNP
jgi:hypothetical protein